MLGQQDADLQYFRVCGRRRTGGLLRGPEAPGSCLNDCALLYALRCGILSRHPCSEQPARTAGNFASKQSQGYVRKRQSTSMKA
jgi:hypothetical protein